MEEEQIEKKLDRVSYWIKTTDQKVSIFLAFQGIILALVFPHLCAYIFDPKYYHTLCSFVIVALGVSCVLVGVFISIMTITPKLDNTHKKSILYFKDISSMKFEEYKKKVNNLTKEEYKDSLLEQIHVLSGIATRKNEQFMGAVFIFAFGVILICVCLLTNI